ncbi:winged helix-turn-helix transcriptional regulator [Halostagnicola larsenii]|nr:helix-turn-helix domain-containing protein [Halostagnicola larsenii]
MDSPISSGTVAFLALVVVCAIVAGATGSALATTAPDYSLEEVGSDDATLSDLEIDTESGETTLENATDDEADSLEESTDETTDSVDGSTDEVTGDDGDSTNGTTRDEDEDTDGEDDLTDADDTLSDDDLTDDPTDTDATDESGGSAEDTGEDPVDASSVDDDTADPVSGTNDSITNGTDGLEETSDSLNDTTDAVSNATNETTGGLEGTVENTTGGLDGATDELEKTTDKPANETGSFLEKPVRSASDVLAGTTAGAEAGISTTVSSVTSTGLSEASETISAVVDDDSPVGSALAGGEPADPGVAQTATDAILVGMLGAVAASAGAAGGIGATGGTIGAAGGGLGAAGGGIGGAGAAGSAGATAGAGLAGGTAGSGAGAASGSGTTGAASNAVANWTASGRRYLRRALASIPWELLPIFKYSRYDDSDPLENETRATIYETVEAHPGRYLSQISDDADVPLSTVRHHVRILEEEDLLTAAKINGKRRYYLEETDSTLQAALEEPAKRDVLEALATLERANNSELAAELERDPSTITHHLSTLEDDGLVVRNRDGRSVVTELATETKAALGEDDISTLKDASPQAPAD